MLLKILKISLGVVICSTLFVLVLGLFLSMHWAQGWIKSYAVGKINESQRAQLQLEQFRYSLLSGVSLKSLHLQLPSGMKLSVAEMNIDFRPWDLFARRVIIQKVDVVTATLSFIRSGQEPLPIGEDQVPSIPDLMKLLSEAIPVLPFEALEVKSYRIHKMSLRLLSDSKPVDLQELTWRLIKGDARYSVANDGPKVTFSLSAYSGQSSLFSQKIELLTIDTVFSKATIEINQLAVKTKESKLIIDGFIEPRNNRVDLRLRADPFSFSDFKSLVSVDNLPVSLETVSAQLSVSGLPDDLRFKGSLKSGMLQLQTNGLIDVSNLRSPVYSISAQLSKLDTVLLTPGINDHLREWQPEQLNLSLEFTGRGLRLNEIEGSLALSLVPGPEEGEKFQQTKIMAEIERGKIKIKQGTLESTAGLLRVEGDFNIAGLYNREEDLHFRLKAQGEKVDLAKILGSRELKSQLNFHIESEGSRRANTPWTSLAVQLKTDIMPSKLGPLSFNRSSLQANYQEGKLELAEVDIHSQNSRLLLQGFATKDRSIDLKYTLKATDLYLLNLFYPQLKVQGEVEGSGVITGIWPELLVEGKIKVKNFTAPGLAISAGQVDFSAVKIIDEPGTNAEISLEAVNYKEFHLENVKASLKLGKVATSFSLSAFLPNRASIALAGEGENLFSNEREIFFHKVEFQNAETSWKNEAKITLTIDEKGVSLSDFVLVNPPQKLSISGFFSFSGPSRIQLMADQLDLRILSYYPSIGRRIAGKVNIRADWKGTFENPEIESSIHASSLRYGEFNWEALDLKFAYRQNKVNLLALLSSEKSEVLYINGFIDGISLSSLPASAKKAVVSLKMRSSHLNLAAFAPIKKELGSLTGLLTMDFDMEGPLLSPHINGSIHIKKADLPMADLITTSGGSDAGSVSFEELSLSVVNLNLRALDKGEVDLRVSALKIKGKEIDSLMIDGTGEKAGWLFRTKLVDPDKNLLSTEAFVRFSNAGHPDRIDIRKVDLEVNGRPLKSEGEIGISLADGFHLMADSFRIKGEDVEFSVEGQVTGGKADLRLESQLTDLTALTGLLKTKRLVNIGGGKFVLKAAINGSIDRPDIRGSAQAWDWKIALPSLGTKYVLEKGLVQMDGARVELRELILKDPHGSLTIQGYAGLKGFTIDDLMIKTEAVNFQIVDSRQYSLQTSGRINLGGSLDRPLIQGDLVIKRGRINLTKEIYMYHPEIKFADGKNGEDNLVILTEKAEGGLWKGSSLNVKVDVPANFRLKGDDYNLELSGGLVLFKEPLRPAVYTGSLSIVRGNYQFYGKNFTLAAGTIDFPGISSLNPNLNIEAVYKVSKVQISILTKGTLNKPEITLQSDPPMPETEIFSYLAFGKPSSQLTQREAGSFQSQAASFLGGRVASQLKDILGEKFALDTVEITTNTEKGAAGGTTQVGKYLSDNLYLEYGRTFGSESGNKVNTEYKLGKYFTLESEIGGQGETGVDIIFNLDY